MDIKKEKKICEDAILVLNKWLEIEYYSVNRIDEDMIPVVHGLLTAKAIFEDLIVRYEKELDGIETGIYKIMKLLEDKGYGSIANEIESELKGLEE